ncbi:MAG: hypothetical protein HOM87_08705, partial [Proteobacteria bacterium]|nr:hypothetical protein [Pseudomonadota bacterium]
MDSPTRELANTLAAVDRDLEEMEKHQREHETILNDYDRLSKTDVGISTKPDGTVDLKDLIAHHRSKALGNEQPTYIQPGPGFLHGTVVAAKDLHAADGTCDPFVKVSYVPPVEGTVKTSMIFRCKETVHTTGVVPKTTEPTFADGAFIFEVAPPAAGDGVPFHIESDWSRLQGDLLFTAYDCNNGMRNERMGQVVFPLRSLVDGTSPSTVEGGPQKIHDRWFDMETSGKSKNSSPKLRLQMTLILPNEVKRSVGEYDEVEFKDTVAGGVARALEDEDENDFEHKMADGLGSSTEEEEAAPLKAVQAKRKKKVKKKTKIKIDRGAERRERERKLIAKENLILQMRMEKAMKDRAKRPSPYGVNKASSMKQFNADKKNARERLAKRIADEDKILKERIAKVRGRPKKNRFEGMDETLIAEHHAEQAAKDKKKALEVAGRRYKKQIELMEQINNLTAEIRNVREEASLLKSKSQRLETSTKKNAALLQKALDRREEREINMQREKKVRTSALPKGARSSLTKFAEARESDFTKLQREYDAQNGKDSKPQVKELYGGDDKEGELDDLKIQLRHASSTYEQKQRRRRELVKQAKTSRERHKELTKDIEEADIKLKEVEKRRQHRIAKFSNSPSKPSNDAEEQYRIEQVHKINQQERQTKIEIRSLEAEIEELEYTEKMRKEAHADELAELKMRIADESDRLKAATEKRDGIKAEVDQIESDKTIHALESEVRDLRHLAALCRVSESNRRELERLTPQSSVVVDSEGSLERAEEE